jgi:hypothetical protein
MVANVMCNGSLYYSSANVEVVVEDCTLMGYDAVLIGNLFLHFGRGCCRHVHGMRRSIVMQIYIFDTQLASGAKNLWRICTVENSYPFLT